MAKKKISIDVDEELAGIAEDGATIQGTTLSEVLQRGESLTGIVHNQLNQALWRKIQKGEYPADLVAEVKAEADRVRAAKAVSA